MRGFASVPIAIVVCVAAPAFASAQSHVRTAKKAEKRGEWRRALQEWKAAYKAEPNAEYLIGIGDAYAHLGDKAQAKKSYEAYLADPLALPASVTKVKATIAQLDAPAGGALALPGPGLTLPGTAAAAAPAARKPEPTLPLPGLDAPEAAAQLALPGTAKKEPDKVASLPPLPLPAAALPPQAAPAKTPAKPVATVAAERPMEKAPAEAVTATAVPRQPGASSGGVQRTMAFVTAGVAIAALGGGALAYTKANSAHDDLTGSVHTGAEAQRLLETESSNRTLSLVGFAGGLLAAGISAALFAF